MIETHDYRTSHLKKGEDYDRDLAVGDLNTYMALREREILTRVMPSLFPGGIPRYLDFACGTGRVTQTIAPLARESFGVDVSETMLEQARRKCPGTTFFVRDVTRDGPPVTGVDLVSAFRFFGNAQNELRVAVLRAINAMVADGGYFVLNNHRNPGSLTARLRRLRGTPETMDLTYPKIERLLADAGFRVEQVHGIALWVVRAKLEHPRVLFSRMARVMEPLSRLPLAYRVSPDMVIVARKVRNLSK